MIGSIIGWIVFGLVVGVIARFVIPGPQPMGLVMTILLGVAGSFLGGFIASLIGGGGIPAELQPSSFLWSLLGAAILLLGYGMLRKRA